MQIYIIQTHTHTVKIEAEPQYTLRIRSECCISAQCMGAELGLLSEPSVPCAAPLASALPSDWGPPPASGCELLLTSPGGYRVDRIKENLVYVFSLNMPPMSYVWLFSATILVRMKQSALFPVSWGINNLNALQGYCFKLDYADRLDKERLRQSFHSVRFCNTLWGISQHFSILIFMKYII